MLSIIGVVYMLARVQWINDYARVLITWVKERVLNSFQQKCLTWLPYRDLKIAFAKKAVKPFLEINQSCFVFSSIHII